MTELEQQWVRALEVTSAALEAAVRAHTLPPDEIGARRRRLAVESTWLATVDWLGIGESDGASVTVLETPSSPVRASRVRAAA